MTTNSTWAALRNPTFRKLWIAAVISGTCMAAHDSAATWMMNLVFSPHAWGWSGGLFTLRRVWEVLPTRVRMVRDWRWSLHLRYCSPHTRGDGPPQYHCAVERCGFSPHAWGWPPSSQAALCF